ncbi:unnamed protein product, partial [Polarella glacialis]
VLWVPSGYGQQQEPSLLSSFHSAGHQLVLDGEDDVPGGQRDSKQLSFRQRYEKELKEVDEKYRHLEPEFSDDDMNETLPEEDRKRGWQYPLTKTQQKKEYGCVLAEQQRFLWRLQDGHLDIVEDYLGNPKKSKAVDINRYDEQGWTPLHHAARLDHSEIVRVLLDAHADPTLRHKASGQTALDFAKGGKNTESGPNEDTIDVLTEFGVLK